MQLADLTDERPDRDRVLEEAAEVGVVPGARAWGATPVGPQRDVGQERLQQGAVRGVVDLAGEVLEEAVELLDVAVGDGQERGRVAWKSTNSSGSMTANRSASRPAPTNVSAEEADSPASTRARARTG